jgi:hypothetical protein
MPCDYSALEPDMNGDAGGRPRLENARAPGVPLIASLGVQ